MQGSGSREGTDVKGAWGGRMGDGTLHIVLVTNVVICQSSSNYTLKIREFSFI